MSPPNWPGQQVSGGTAPARSNGPVLRDVYTAPNPDQEHDNANQDAQLRVSQANLGLNAESNARQAKTAEIGNAATLRQGYEGLAPVKEYRATLPNLLTGLRARPDATGDNTLLYAYAKVMDPPSVVRESEQANAANGASVFDGVVANLKKQLGIEGGGALPPEVRLRLKRDMNSKAIELYRNYLLQRQRFSDDAEAYGIDPARVVGPNDFEAYRPQYDQAFKQVFGRDSYGREGKANVPEQRGGLAVGTDIQFNMDKGPSGPFDRAAYVQQTYGLNPDQETNLVAFLNANSGNKGITPEAIKAWYAQNGIPAPSDADLVDVAGKLQAGGQWGPFDTSGPEKAYRDQLQQRLNQQGYDPTNPNAYADRFAQGALLGNFDEIMGVGGALSNLVNNKGVADGYTLSRDTARLAQEQARQQQGYLGAATEFTGGLVPGLLTGNPTSVAGAARQGAALGGIAGFGYGEGLNGSLAGLGGGALLGGGAGAAVQRGLNAAIARRATQAANPTDGAQVIQAADRLNNQLGTNIQPLPADVGGPGTRMATGAAATLPLGAGPIVSGAQNVSAEAKAARDAIAKLAGNPAELETAGEAALTGAQKFIKASRAKVNSLYTKARQLGGTEPVDLAEARQALDQQIAELSQVPGGSPGLDKLKALRAQLDRPYPVEGVRGMRTNLRDQFLGDGLRGSDLERRVGLVVDAAENDIVNSLKAAGKDSAASAYAEAAAAHKERVGIIDNILAPIIGAKGDAPKSGEQIMAAIQSATKQNNARLGAFLNSLPAEDAASVRATLISRLGNASNGTQNAAGDAFSLPQFLTHWNAMTPAAKRTLFGGDLRAALDDLAKVAEGTKQAQRFENSSKTGAAASLLATGGLLTQASSHPIATVLGVAGQYGLGKLLSSPRFARWLARVPANPQTASTYVQGLSKVAAADSVIAADALQLQAKLRQAFGNGPNSPVQPIPLRAAAQSQPDQGNGESTGTAGARP